MQHTSHILHTPGHCDFVQKAFEEESLTSPRHSSRRELRERTPSPPRRAAQRGRRERISSPPPLMSDSDSSDDESGLDGEEAMHQCNPMGVGLGYEEEDPEEGDPNPEEEGPTSSYANALVPVGGPVDGGGEDDP